MNKYIKKLTLFVLIILAFQSVNSQTSKDLIGKWKDIKLPYKYEFRKTSVIYTQSGYPVLTQYAIDSTKTPLWIDFTIKGGRTVVIPGLMKWKGKDTLWIQQFPPYPNHPTEFGKDSISNSRKIHILIREK